MTLFEELEQRGVVKQTSSETVKEMLNNSSVTFYCGFDPTADSLHVGSLLPLVTMKRLQNAGHKALALAGSATGRIGDPSFKASERSMLSDADIENNLNGIRQNISTIIQCEMVSNIDWFSKINMLDFLRDTGKMFTVNNMMAKDSVKSRLEDREQGISFTEFSYMILQAFDFKHLFESKNCVLQIGGSDQWGNITAGIDLTRKALGKEVFGLTLPLLTKADGSKFGKSENGNVWLNASRTSPFDFFQFFLKSDDKDVIKLLKMLTFLSLDEISILEQSLQSEPQLRKAQKALAVELTRMVHGEEALLQAQQRTEAILSGQLFEVNVEKKSEEVIGKRVAELLCEVELCSSKGMARKDIEGNGISIFGEKIKDPNLVIDSSHLQNGLLVLRKGKMNTKVIKVI